MGNTYTSPDGSMASIQSIHNTSVVDGNGDTIIIPNGSYAWSGASTLNINKSCTIRAATTTSSALMPARPTTSPPIVTTPPSVTISFSDSSSGPHRYLINLNSSANGNVILAGINFQSGAAVYGQDFWMDTNGSGKPVIIHDCAFQYHNFSGSYWQWHATGGLIYNCWYHSEDTGGANGPGSGGGCFEVYSGYPWYNSDTLGASDTNGDVNLYIEQCQFDNIYNQCIDLVDNARIVIRNSIVNNCQFIEHGVTGNWGSRHVEFYNNCFNMNPRPDLDPGEPYCAMNRWNWFRAGTGRIWGNSVDNPSAPGGVFGIKQSWDHIDEPLTRSGVGNGGQCESQSNYPGTRWPATGTQSTWSNGGTRTSPGPGAPPTGVIVGSGTSYGPSPVNPIYYWSNIPGPHSNGTSTVDGDPNGGGWQTSDQTGSTKTCSGGSTGNVFLVNREIFIGGTTAPTGYTPYVYPHPLNETSSPTAPTPPVLTSIITGPTPSFVQMNGFVVTTTATSNSCPYNSAQVAGHCNLAWVLTSNAVTINSVVDTALNTYSLLYSEVDSTGAWQIAVYISNGIKAAATNTVTAQLSATSWSEMVVGEYSGVVATSPSDINVDGQGSGTVTSAPITTINATDLIVSFAAYVFPVVGVTTPANWNLEFSTSPQTGTVNVADIQVYSPGSFNPAWTLASTKTWDVVNIALKSTITTPPAQRQFSLSWNSVSNATNYNLYYGTINPVTKSNSTQLILGNVTNYTLTGLANNTYYLVVTATNSIGESAFSNQVSGNITTGPVLINASVLIR